MAGLLLVACHPRHHADLIVDDLLDVLLVVIEVLPVTSQPHVLTIELFLDDGVPLPQAFYQRLVVGYKELDMLPILARLLFETVALENAFFKLKLNRPKLEEHIPSVVHFHTSPTASSP